MVLNAAKISHIMKIIPQILNLAISFYFSSHFCRFFSSLNYVGSFGGMQLEN
jgi:hypothetical protein